MTLTQKFGLYGIDDERARRVIFPTRVVLTRGKVLGFEHLTEYRPAQVALDPCADDCILDNRASDTNAAVLVDFGREIHGTVTVSVRGATEGHAHYILRLGESVTEALTPVGERNATNNHAMRDWHTETAQWSSNETNESGFRYAYIEFLNRDAYMELRCLTATLVYRDIEYRGTFESSDPLIDKIYDTAAYTTHLCMQRYLWDGIKRDRLIWAGDMNTEIATILAVFGENDVVPKSLDLVRDITPVDQSMNGIPSYNLWWILSHYQWYMGTGNYEYLKQQKDYIAALLTRYMGYISAEGRWEELGREFFDWPTNNHPDAKECGLHGLLRQTLLAGGEIMKVLGESAIAAQCYIAADRLLAYKPNPGCWKQSAALLVAGGVLDAKEVYKNNIAPGGAEGLSTFLGYFTLNAIAQAGEYNAALNVIRDYWGKMLELGATTFWEDFNIDWTRGVKYGINDIVPAGELDIHADFGAFCYEKLRHSLCHGWASGPAPYLAANVLGITPVEPGCKTVRFAPHLSGLDWARGMYPTPYGDIEIEITKSGASCKAPDGVKVIGE